MGGKQKVVMRVPVGDVKSRSRALKTVVGVPGLISASLEGADKNLVVVIGDGIDSVGLTISLRKKLGNAELVTVAPVEEKKGGQEKKPENKDNKNPVAFPWPYDGPRYIVYASEPPAYNPSQCSIL